MALSDPKTIFGVHSVALYNVNTGLPLTDICRVIGTFSMNLSGELIELNGGSLPFPWSVENGLITTESSLLLREYPQSVYEAFLGASYTDNSAEAGGNASTLTNKSGTSTVNASTGIASVSVKSGSEADLKTGRYVVQVASATTVNVYCLSDVDFKNGTDLDFVDDTLKVTSSALTITASTPVTIPSCGLELTGGSGTIGMTTGDTATFEVRAINGGSQIITIGSTPFALPNVGIVAVAQKAGDNSIYEIDIYKAKGAGSPISFAEKAFSEAEIPIKAFYDSTRNGVAQIRRVENTA